MGDSRHIDSVPAVADPVHDSAFVGGHRDGDYSQLDVTMSYSGTVHSGDRLAISGKEYEVLTARADFAWRTALRVECILVEK